MRKRKKRAEALKQIAVCIAFIITMVGGMLIGGYIDSTYTMIARVAKQGNEMYFVDIQGEEWNDDRAYDYKAGTEVKLTFGNNGTHNRKDDIIRGVK